jgi:ArsR family transcriptional regulator
VRTHLADAHELPFHQARFDAVFVFHTLAYAAIPRRVVAECARVLRPTGRLVLLSVDKHEQTALTASYGERHAGFAPNALEKMLAEAGFIDISAEVACREAKKPHLKIVLAVAEKPRLS